MADDRKPVVAGEEAQKIAADTVRAGIVIEQNANAQILKVEGEDLDHLVLLVYGQGIAVRPPSGDLSIPVTIDGRQAYFCSLESARSALLQTE